VVGFSCYNNNNHINYIILNGKQKYTHASCLQKPISKPFFPRQKGRGVRGVGFWGIRLGDPR